MPKDRVETAQLQREIVGVAVHDLGSVAAALVMRAAMPPASALADAVRQQAAMGSLAGQVRAAMQLLDVARISPSALTAEPLTGVQTGATLETWLQRWPTLARVALPRGARLQVSAAESPSLLTQHAFTIGHVVDAVATQVLLSGLHVVQAPGHVTLHVTLHDAEDLQTTLQCTMQTTARIGGRRRSGTASRSRWQRHVEHVLGTVDWPFQWWAEDANGNSSLGLTVPLSRAQPKESV